jgi:hypothetical protein
MGRPTSPEPVLLILAAFSRHEMALDWSRCRAAEQWGPIALESPPFEFTETEYYTPTMGQGLRKVFFAFERLFDPGELAARKLQTNQWEAEYAALASHPDPRPLNLDPGYIALGKLVLASTKDFAHRVYLGQGIYAEVTLTYKHNAWQWHEWTFPDYCRADYQEFFSRCRNLLRGRRQHAASGSDQLGRDAIVPAPGSPKVTR